MKKRTNEWRRNISGIFNSTASNNEHQARREALKAKYGSDPRLQPRLNQAMAVRQAGIPIAQKKSRHSVHIPSFGKRTNEWRRNISGIFNSTASNAEHLARREALKAKYGSDPRLQPRLNQAMAVRQAGIPIAQRKMALDKHGRVHNRFDVVGGSSSKDKLKIEPLINGGQPFDLRAPPPQFYADLKAMVDPMFAERQALAASGGTVCGKKNIAPHQKIVFEICRAMFHHGMHAMGGCRGLLCWHGTGSGKCWKYDTPILMYDGSVKMVQDVLVGDEVMGDDSTPRQVLSLGRGREPMYDIVPTKKNAETWGCNASHILVLKYLLHKKIEMTRHKTLCVRYHDGNGGFQAKNFKTAAAAATFAEGIPDEHATVHMELRDYLQLKNRVKHVLKMYKTGVDFQGAKEPCFDPYVLGAWLGDGSSRSTTFCICEAPLVEELQMRFKKYDMELVPSKVAFSKAPMYNAKSRSTTGQVGGNPFRNALMEYGMMGKDAKHVPYHIKTGTRNVRLQVLAGLLDTDGTYSSGCYDIIQKNKIIADDIVFIARSLGFAAYVTPCRKGCTYRDQYREATYFRVSISGAGLDEIPVVLERKKAAPRKQIKNALHYGFTVVPRGEGDYYGFTVNGNHRLVLGDFTVSHNTVLAASIYIAAKLAEKTTGVKYNVCLVTTRDNKKNNDPKKYAHNIRAFFPEYMSLVGLPKMEKGMTDAEWDAIAIPIMTKNLPVFTTTTNTYGAREVKENEVVIIDEFQNLIEPRMVDKQYEGNTEAIRKKLRANESKMYIFPLTATPSGGKRSNFAKMANFIKPLGTPDFTESSPPQAYKGLISYVETREDRSVFGELKGTGLFHARVKNLEVAMGSRYCFAFLQSFSESDLADISPGQAEDLYMKKLTQKASILSKVDAKKANIDLEQWEQQKRVVRITARNTQVVLSNKMLEVIKNITSMPGKQFVFAANLNISKCIEAALLQHHGYMRVSVKDLAGCKDAKDMTKCNLFRQGPKLRYMCYGTGKRDAFKGPHGNTPVDQFLDSHLDPMKQIMGHESNLHGEYCKIMVAMGSNYEGLDIPAWRGVHIVQPLSTKDADEQAIGRALRFCGHSALPPQDRNAYVVRYFSVMPDKFDPEAIASELKGAAAETALEKCDENLKHLRDAGLYKGRSSPNVIVFADAQMKQKALDDFEACVHQYAVDCPLLHDALKYSHPCGGNTCVGASSGINFSKFGVNKQQQRPSGQKKPQAVAPVVAAQPPRKHVNHQPNKIKTPMPFTYTPRPKQTFTSPPSTYTPPKKQPNKIKTPMPPTTYTPQPKQTFMSPSATYTPQPQYSSSRRITWRDIWKSIIGGRRPSRRRYGQITVA